VPLVHVRRAAVVPVDALRRRLTAGERARVDGAAPGDRDAVASSLVLARLTVADVCAVDPGTVRVRRRCPRCGSTQHGVPAVDVGDGTAAPHLSLSRGGHLVVVALCDAGAVGVDVEAVPQADGRPCGQDPDDLARVVLAPGEPPAAGPHGLLRTWARTEAVLKAAGTGLAVDPRALRVSDPAGRPEVRVVDPAAAPALTPGPGARWWLTDLDLGADHVAALAALLPSPPAVDDRTTTLA
jgi:4'-phosphopantetheinyl transferase